MIEKRTGEFYERDAATYDRRWVSAGGGATLTSQRQIVCDLGGEWRGRRILEVGCGTGRFSPFVAETAKETAFVDLSIEMLKTTRRKLHPMGKPFAGVNASIYRLPIRDNTFDGALCVNVFNHLDSPDLALRELARVLTPKGTLVVNFANRQSYYWPAAFVINRRRRAIGRNVFSSWLSPSEILEYLSAAGLRVTKMAGNVHIPPRLDLPVVRSVLCLLDRASRYSALKRWVPSLFVKCEKISLTD